jgi:hypothetical protein
MKPIDHPDYEFAPGCFNLSKWSRENIPKPKPKFKLGDKVVLTTPLTITKIGKDCDGSTLYSLSFDEGAHLESNPERYTAKLDCIGEESLKEEEK